MPRVSKDALQQEEARTKLWALFGSAWLETDNKPSWARLERLGYGNRGLLNRIAHGKKRAPKSLLKKLGIGVPGTSVTPRKNWKRMYIELASLLFVINGSEAICGTNPKGACTLSLVSHFTHPEGIL